MGAEGWNPHTKQTSAIKQTTLYLGLREQRESEKSI